MHEPSYISRTAVIGLGVYTFVLGTIEAYINLYNTFVDILWGLKAPRFYPEERSTICRFYTISIV
jgi:hypothetical protein